MSINLEYSGGMSVVRGVEIIHRGEGGMWIMEGSTEIILFN